MSAAALHRDVDGLLRVHGYQQLKKVGEGSFGKALLVKPKDDESKLICKMVDVSCASKKEVEESAKEAKILAAFKHPYIVRYRESFVQNGWLCILMDYCEGGDLAGQVERSKKRNQPLSEEQVQVWFTQALLALKYIHEKHVLHRDLKSANFFLSKSGSCKMGDFGIAKVLSSTAACAKTQTGTPYYLAPEICQEKPYAWPADIWAMGVILYELCERKMPFDAANITSLVQKICRGDTPRITAPGYSDSLKTLSADMLNKEQSKRPSAEAALARPKMQEVVKQMLNQHQRADGKENQGDKQEIAGNRRPSKGSEPGVIKPFEKDRDSRVMELPVISKPPPPPPPPREPSPVPGRAAVGPPPAVPPSFAAGPRVAGGALDRRGFSPAPAPRLPSPGPAGATGQRAPSPPLPNRVPSPVPNRSASPVPHRAPSPGPGRIPSKQR